MRLLPAGKGQSGFTVLEIVVASAILMLIAWQIADAMSTNVEARARIETQRQFVEVEGALRSAVFRKASVYMENAPNCASPKAGLEALFATQPLSNVNFALVKPSGATLPPAMNRCKTQTSDVTNVRNGIYMCVTMSNAGASKKSFLAANDVYAEVFYGFWDVWNNKALTCPQFNDVFAPLRGAKLFYTMYWRPKAGKQAKGKFLSYSGVMYGQSKEP